MLLGSDTAAATNTAPNPAGATDTGTVSVPNTTASAGSASIDLSNWKSALPEDLQKDPSLSSINDIQSLAKSFVHAQKLVGRDKIVIPDKHATADDWKNIYRKLGLPEDKTKYEFKAPEGTDPAFLDQFKEFALQENILPSQAEKLFSWYDNFAATVSKQAQEKSQMELAESVNGLKKEWGAAYDRKLQAASNLFKQTVDADTQKFFVESGLANNPHVVKVFAKIAEKMGEDKFVDGASTGRMGFTPQEAQTRINEIMGNKTHPYWDRQHASHKDAVQEVQKLFQMVSGS